MVISGGVAGLADRYTQNGRIERDLGNERVVTGGCGLDRPSQVLADTHQLIEISCATRNLGDRTETECNAQDCHVRLLDAGAEGGVRWRPPQLHAQRLGEHSVMADGEGLPIPQALSSSEDSE